MERRKTIRITSIIAFIVSVLSISIAYAAMSRNIIIKENVKEDINVHFDNLSPATTKGRASVSTRPKMKYNKVLIHNMKFKLFVPNDEVKYTVDIVNENNYDVKISYIINPYISSDDSKIFEFVSFYTNSGKKIKIGDTLKAKEKKNITLIFRYKDITNSNLLSKTPREINISYNIVYVRKQKPKNYDSSEYKKIDEFIDLYNKILFTTKQCARKNKEYCSYKSIKVPEGLNLVECKNDKNYYYVRLSATPIGRYNNMNLFDKYNKDKIREKLNIDQNYRKVIIDSNSISIFYYEGNDFDYNSTFSCDPF